MNAESLNDNVVSVANNFVTRGIDILAFSKMWFGSDYDPFVISESVSAG